MSYLARGPRCNRGIDGKAIAAGRRQAGGGITTMVSEATA